jgi:rfaE bifunctional protein kinase chain/domain
MSSTDLIRLSDLLDSFPRRRILVLGDLVADEFIFGEISRVSREAPVLILRHRETRLVPGGGANAVHNLASLGARVLPVGAVGDDPAGDALLAFLRARLMDTSGIVRVKKWTTPTKSRFLAGWTHTSRQQVLRLDREPSAPLPAAALAAIERRALRLASRADAVLFSDYGYGAVTPSLAKKIRNRIKTLDSRHRLLDYTSSGITAATPNEPELEALFHTRIADDSALLENLAHRVLRRMKLASLVVTRGKDGMVVFLPNRPPHAIPIFGSDQVVDVTGAGDTVIAVFTLALAAGATFTEAAELANFAGGIVVTKHGTATVSREELASAIRSALTSQPPSDAA